MVTFRTKVKRYPAWQFAVAAFLGIAGLSFNGWLAYQFLGWSSQLVWEAVIVFSIMLLLFVPLLYRAYEIRFRERNPMAVPKAFAAFLTVFFLLLLYYIDKSGLVSGNATARTLTLIVLLAAFAAGMLFTIYGVKHELD